MELTKEQNKALCDKYPFLIPRNVWSGMRITEAQNGGFWPGDPEAVPDPPYDYEYTALDDMPDGWRIAFGEQMCEEIKQELLRAGGEKFLNEYYPTQIKEKYGGLRWYDNGFTEEGFDIISKYEKLSERTCIVCGKPAKWITCGWIMPFCDDCIDKSPDCSTAIEDYFAADDEEEGDEP